MSRRLLFALLASATLESNALAQSPAAAQAQPIADTVPPARDIPWTAGPIRLEVDATDNVRRIIQVRETIPVVAPGPLTLLFPAWLPGKHDARGEIEKLAGLTITAGGQRIEWRRDPIDVYAFHVDVPASAGSIEARFQFLAPTAADQGRIVITDALANIQWNNVSLYPAGYFVRRIPIQASVMLPAGWTAAGALRGNVRSGADSTTVAYEATDYETLVDSPIFAGRYAKSVDLGHNVSLDLFADDPPSWSPSPSKLLRTKNWSTRRSRSSARAISTIMISSSRSRRDWATSASSITAPAKMASIPAISGTGRQP